MVGLKLKTKLMAKLMLLNDRSTEIEKSKAMKPTTLGKKRINLLKYLTAINKNLENLLAIENRIHPDMVPLFCKWEKNLIKK